MSSVIAVGRPAVGSEALQRAGQCLNVANFCALSPYIPLVSRTVRSGCGRRDDAASLFKKRSTPAHRRNIARCGAEACDREYVCQHLRVASGILLSSISLNETQSTTRWVSEVAMR